MKMMNRYWFYRTQPKDVCKDELKKTITLQGEQEKAVHSEFLNKFSLVVDRFYDPQIDYENLDVVLTPVNNDLENNMWDYFRFVVSRVPSRGFIGKVDKFFLRDLNSNTILGIMSLTSPLLGLGRRDEYYGVDAGMKKQLKLIRDDYNEFNPNMSTCVPLYPFGRFNGGKLIAQLTLTDEIINHYKKKYNITPFGIHTTSIYGKSIQYDRIYEFDFVGLTKGHGVVHYSGLNTQSVISKYLGRYFDITIPRNQIGKSVIGLIQKAIGLNKAKVNMGYHGMCRGIYCFRVLGDRQRLLDWVRGDYREFERKVYRYPERRDLQYHHLDVQHTKAEFWKERWFKKRWEKYGHEVKDYKIDYYIYDSDTSMEQISQTSLNEMSKFEFIERKMEHETARIPNPFDNAW
jgi:hypothetical protein